LANSSGNIICTFSVLQFCLRQYGSSFIHLAFVVSQICKILRKFEFIAVQVYPRSSALVPIESAYVTSYQSLIVTLDVSFTVFEMLTYTFRI